MRGVSQRKRWEGCCRWREQQRQGLRGENERGCSESRGLGGSTRETGEQGLVQESQVLY